MGRNRTAWAGRLVASAAMLAVCVAQAGALAPPPDGLDARAISRRADRSLRGDKTFLEARLTLREKPSVRPQELVFRLWDDRFTERCFVRVIAPEAAAGAAFLKLPPNLWTYDLEEERVRRLRPAELTSRLLESDFRIDDLVCASDLTEDYEVRFLGVDPSPDGLVGRRAHVLEYLPRVVSPLKWSRIVAWVDTEWGAPLRRDYYDDQGTLVRVIRFGGIREVQGRYLPHVWTASSPSSRRESRIDVERVDFSPDIAGSIFTTRNLKPPE